MDDAASSPASVGAEARLDARGLLCPLPVLKARKTLSTLPTGALLEVLADDAIARIDLPHFCAEAGHSHLSVTESEDATGRWQVHLIRKGPVEPDSARETSAG